MSLLAVFREVITPIFLIIGVGVLMDRTFRLDLRTLAKLNFYVFVPALAFVSLMQSGIDGDVMTRIAVFAAVQVAFLFAIGLAVFRARGLRDSATVLTLGAMFYNCGNYGFPLVAMAFGESYQSAAAVVLVVQNLLTFTFGIFLLEKEHRTIGQVAAGFLRIPVIYAVLLPLILRWTGVELAAPLMRSLGYLGNGLIPLALITLGAQLSRTPGLRNVLPVSTVSFIRLVLSPAAAALILLIPWFGFTDTVNAVLIAMAGLPVGVNVYILASQYGRDEDIASQSVFWSTLVSALSITAILALLR